jgi:hypothetical protein
MEYGRYVQMLYKTCRDGSKSLNVQRELYVIQFRILHGSVLTRSLNLYDSAITQMVIYN